jgi:hypothetical protein
MYLNLHTSCAMSLGESKSGMFFYNQPTYMADSDRSYSEENASLISHSLIASVLMMGPYVGGARPYSTDGTCSITCFICNSNNRQNC